MGYFEGIYCYCVRGVLPETSKDKYKHTHTNEFTHTHTHTDIYRFMYGLLGRYFEHPYDSLILIA
jgi:hypothetical protein